MAANGQCCAPAGAKNATDKRASPKAPAGAKNATDKRASPKHTPKAQLGKTAKQNLLFYVQKLMSNWCGAQKAKVSFNPPQHITHIISTAI